MHTIMLLLFDLQLRLYLFPLQQSVIQSPKQRFYKTKIWILCDPMFEAYFNFSLLIMSVNDTKKMKVIRENIWGNIKH